jgi:hypothetical protein
MAAAVILIAGAAQPGAAGWQVRPAAWYGTLPSLDCCRVAAGCQRGFLRFHGAAVNASPEPAHLDTSSPNTHPSSQPTPN